MLEADKMDVKFAINDLRQALVFIDRLAISGRTWSAGSADLRVVYDARDALMRLHNALSQRLLDTELNLSSVEND